MKKIWFWIIFIVLILGLITFLLIVYKDKIFGNNNQTPPPPAPPDLVPNSNTSDCNKTASFPLTLGSKGKEVGVVQNYILKTNPNALPNYGADCDWGLETQTAVLSNLGKVTITQADYTAIVGGTVVNNNAPPASSSVIGKNAFAATNGVQTWYKDGFDLIQTYNRGEFIGSVKKVEPGTPKFYNLGGVYKGGRIVLASAVTLS